MLVICIDTELCQNVRTLFFVEINYYEIQPKIWFVKNSRCFHSIKFIFVGHFFYTRYLFIYKVFVHWNIKKCFFNIIKLYLIYPFLSKFYDKMFLYKMIKIQQQNLIFTCMYICNENKHIKTHYHVQFYSSIFSSFISVSNDSLLFQYHNEKWIMFYYISC